MREIMHTLTQSHSGHFFDAHLPMFKVPHSLYWVSKVLTFVSVGISLVSTKPAKSCDAITHHMALDNCFLCVGYGGQQGGYGGQQGGYEGQGGQGEGHHHHHHHGEGGQGGGGGGYEQQGGGYGQQGGGYGGGY